MKLSRADGDLFFDHLDAAARYEIFHIKQYEVWRNRRTTLGRCDGAAAMAIYSIHYLPFSELALRAQAGGI